MEYSGDRANFSSHIYVQWTKCLLKERKIYLLAKVEPWLKAGNQKLENLYMEKRMWAEEMSYIGRY